MLVGGTFSVANGQSRRALVRLLPDGALDSSFTVGSGVDGSVNAFAIQPDGRAAGFTLIAVAVAAPLVPLSMNLVAALSPQGAVILGQLSPLASLVRNPSHSLSLDPSRTQLGLAFFGGFVLLLLGTACVLRRDSANRLAGTIVIFGAILATVGIVQQATFTGRSTGRRAVRTIRQ